MAGQMHSHGGMSKAAAWCKAPSKSRRTACTAFYIGPTTALIQQYFCFVYNPDAQKHAFLNASPFRFSARSPRFSSRLPMTIRSRRTAPCTTIWSRAVVPASNCSWCNQAQKNTPEDQVRAVIIWGLSPPFFPTFFFQEKHGKTGTISIFLEI